MPLAMAGLVVVCPIGFLVDPRTLILAFLLFRADLGDPARSLAIRAGTLIPVGGMGLAFLMTPPIAAQLDSFQGIAGAHTIGIADGGPGLPLLG